MFYVFLYETCVSSAMAVPILPYTPKRVFSTNERAFVVPLEEVSTTNPNVEKL